MHTMHPLPRQAGMHVMQLTRALEIQVFDPHTPMCVLTYTFDQLCGV